MDLLFSNHCRSCFLLKSPNFYPKFLGPDRGACGHRNSPSFSLKSCSGYGSKTKALAGQNQTKRSRKRENTKKKNEVLPVIEQSSDVYDGLAKPISGTEYVEDGKSSNKFSSDAFEDKTSVIVPSRNAVLQACIVTSSLIASLGFLIRQGSHIASGEGWPVVDCSAAATLNFELWHLELVAGSVILVSSCRLLLLKIWPDFAESSKTANQQVLTSLEPLDYLVVAFLPGISEELLFRGALLPLLGANWVSILAVAALFGALHLGSGRNYSFTIWATFVGILYGYATVLSASITVPMASHALNNLVGGIIWRYSSTTSSKPTE